MQCPVFFPGEYPPYLFEGVLGLFTEQLFHIDKIFQPAGYFSKNLVPAFESLLRVSVLGSARPFSRLR